MNWVDRTADYYIGKMLRQWDMEDYASEIEVERVYRRLAGDLVGRLTQRVSFTKGTLRLKYLSAALRHEMTMRRESLRQTMNAELGGDVVKKILIN